MKKEKILTGRFYHRRSIINGALILYVEETVTRTDFSKYTRTHYVSKEKTIWRRARETDLVLLKDKLKIEVK